MSYCWEIYAIIISIIIPLHFLKDAISVDFIELFVKQNRLTLSKINSFLLYLNETMLVLIISRLISVLELVVVQWNATVKKDLLLSKFKLVKWQLYCALGWKKRICILACEISRPYTTRQKSSGLQNFFWSKRKANWFNTNFL